MQATTQADLFGDERRPPLSEARLIEKLRAIEALFAGATTPGEREAARAAQERIRTRLDNLIDDDAPVEFKFTLSDAWSRKVFLALLRHHGVKPYRYKRQRHTTVMAQLPRRFVDEILWPEFEGLSGVLKAYLAQVTDRVVSQVLQGDGSDADVVTEAPRLRAPPSAMRAAPAPETSPSASGAPGRRNTKKRRKRKRKK